MKFTDGVGRGWDVRITVGDLPALRECGVRPRELLKDDLKGLGELAEDDERFVAALYALCHAQAQAAGVTPEEFGRSLWGDHLADGWDAFCGALADFFPSQRRRVLTALVKTGKDISERLATEAVEGLSGIDPDRAAEAIRLAYRRTTSNGTAGTSPGSADSTPAG